MSAFVRAPRIGAVSRRPQMKTRAAVLPEMYSLLHSYVCPVVKECAGIFVGTEEHQLEVVTKMNVIADHLDIVGVERYVLKALLFNDEQLAIDIANASDTYHASIEVVRHFISKLPNAPIMTPDV
jgi:hypothetical protein